MKDFNISVKIYIILHSTTIKSPESQNLFYLLLCSLNKRNFFYVFIYLVATVLCHVIRYFLLLGTFSTWDTDRVT